MMLTALDMLGAKPMPAKARAQTPKHATAEVAALIHELEALGKQHSQHRDSKIAALAKRALTAASSLRVAHSVVGATPTSVKAAQAVLTQLKSALAVAPSAQKAAAKAPTKPGKNVAAAQAKLRSSAKKAVAAADKLSSKVKAKGAVKGRYALRAASNAARISQRAHALATKLLALASKSTTAAVTAVKAPAQPAVPVRAMKTHVGDDASDAQAQLQGAQQAYDDARAAYDDTVAVLAQARQARDTASSNAPDQSSPNYAAWSQAVDSADADYQAAMSAAAGLIFNDTTLATAAEALTDAQALVAAITGQSTTQGAPAPLPPPPIAPVGGAAVSPATLNLQAGQSARLTFTARGGTGSVLWSSSNSQVATVDQSGNVTGVGPGAANITGAQGSAIAQAQVSVADMSAQAPTGDAAAAPMPSGGGGGGGGGYDDGGGAAYDDGGGAPPDGGAPDGGAPDGPADAGDAMPDDGFDMFAQTEDIVEAGDASTDDDEGDTMPRSLDMLGAFDASMVTDMLPGILKTAGGALSGKPGEKSSDEKKQDELRAEKRKREEAEASAKRLKTGALVVGGIAGLGIVGLILRKVLA